MLSYKIIESIEEFRALRERWDALLDTSPSDTIFLTWEWLFNWWDAFRAKNWQLCIIAAFDSEELLGIAPLYKVSRKSAGMFTSSDVRLIGYGTHASSEYLDFICRKGRESEIIGYLLGVLREQLKPCDLAFFSELSENALLKKYVECDQALKKEEFLIKEKRPFCPYITIPRDWDAYVNGLSKLMRRNVRSAQRKLEQQFRVEVKQHETVPDVRSAFDAFKHLYGQRRQAKREVNKYSQEKYQIFQEKVLKGLSDRRWLHLFLLLLDDAPVAGQYYFKYKEKLYFYQMGSDEKYAKFNVSQNLLSFVIQDAIACKAIELDFLRGQEWYKLRWANGVRKKYTIALAYSFLGKCIIRGMKYKQSFLRLGKRMLPAGLQQKIESRLYQ